MAIPISRRLNFSDIPQIDVSELVSGDPGPALIEQLSPACRDVGFFYVHGHGIKAELIAELREEAEHFFSQPFEQKIMIKLNHRMRGYLPLDYASYEGEENAAKSHQEGFWISHDRPSPDERSLHGANQWPDGLPKLRDVMTRYFAEAERLAEALLRGFSLALGFKADELGHFFEAPMSMLKLNHYPPQDAPESVKHIGVVPHSDSGAITILWQDDGDGLEIENKSGEWIGAPSIPDTFVINLGNLMQIWTNGEFSSTPHRVINRGGRDRYSIPLFVNPSHDVQIRPLNEAVEAETQIFGDYIRASWRRSFPIANIPS